MDLKDKRVTVVGLGNSGVNACFLLRDIGAEVRATDAGDSPALELTRKALEDIGVNVETGGHTEDFIKGSDLVVVSPGIENSSPAARWADKYGIPIIGEMELGYRFCKGKIIAVTGTNGKSTVTTLIGEILQHSGKDAVVCGNIGNSLCGEIQKIKENTWVVLEVSSFQLERIDKFKPNIAVILNIADDHMDRYANFDEYFNEKLKIYKNQDKGDYLILNYDAHNLRELKNNCASKAIFYKKEGSPVFESRLNGAYNRENILASRAVCAIAGVDEDSMRLTIKNFKGLSHRCELVDVVDDVEYIDDSKGTTVDSTRRALESCDKQVILIAGGKDKHSDYSLVRDMLAGKARGLVLIGEAGPAIKKALSGAVPAYEAHDMLSAVRLASRLAKRGDAVLLSPMCSSFDMFIDYKHRGDEFKKAVISIRAFASQGVRT